MTLAFSRAKSYNLIFPGEVLRPRRVLSDEILQSRNSIRCTLTSTSSRVRSHKSRRESRYVKFYNLDEVVFLRYTKWPDFLRLGSETESHDRLIHGRRGPIFPTQLCRPKFHRLMLDKVQHRCRIKSRSPDPCQP